MYLGDIDGSQMIAGALFLGSHGHDREDVAHVTLSPGTRLRALKTKIETTNMSAYTVFYVEVLTGEHAGKHGWMNDNRLIPP
jgi:hypothetical protein